jgi:hypothetical protein
MMVRDAREMREHLQTLPRQKFTLAIAYVAEEEVGYMLSRTMPPGAFRQLPGVRIGAVVDFLVDPARPRVFDQLLTTSLSALGALGASASLTMTTEPKLQRKLLGYGFVSASTPIVGGLLQKLGTPFMYWDRDGKGSEVPWYVTLADSDQDLARAVDDR